MGRRGVRVVPPSNFERINPQLTGLSACEIWQQVMERLSSWIQDDDAIGPWFRGAGLPYVTVDATAQLPVQVRRAMRSNEAKIRRHGRPSGFVIFAAALAVLAAGCGGRTETRVLGVAHARPAAAAAADVTGAIVGIVTSGGQPVSDAELTITGPHGDAPFRVRTGADGTYRLLDVGPGQYRIQAVDTGGSGAWCAGRPVCISDRPAQAEWRPVTVGLGAVVDASFSF